MRWRDRLSGLAMCWVLTVAGLHFSHAEVGSIVDSSSGELRPKGHYEFTVIVEDPDPYGLSWQQHLPPASTRETLNPAGHPNDDGPPSVTYSDGDFPIVAWALNNGTDFDVVYSVLTVDGWTEPVVLAGSPIDELDPDLVVDPSTNTIHVFYWVDSPTPRVMHRRRLPICRPGQRRSKFRNLRTARVDQRESFTTENCLWPLRSKRSARGRRPATSCCRLGMM